MSVPQVQDPTHRTGWWRRVALTAALPFALGTTSQAAVVISQVYGGGGNAGATYKSDFIEIFNNGSSAASIGGWSVQYASATMSSGSWQVTQIPAGTTLQPGQYLLIKEADGSGGTLTVGGDVTGTISMAATAGRVALVNTTTALTAFASSGTTIVDFVGFGTTAATYEGSAPTAAPSNTTAVLRAAAGCTDTNDNAADFSAGAPNPRSSTAPLAPCGGSTTPTPPTTPVATAAKIYAIQGSGATSPLAGQLVVTSGVVTKVTDVGFFIQDLQGDGDPATSDGIYVYTASTPPSAAALGNLVQVTGTVAEYSAGAGTAASPLTEITGPTTVFLGGGYTITPTVVSLPLAEGDSLERFEGMLVRLTGTLTVEQNYYQPRYGQLTIGVGRHETPTNVYRPGSAAAVALAALQARSRLLLDDGSSAQNVNPTPYYFGNGFVRAGDTVTDLVGVLDYGLATSTASGAGLYRLQPTAAPTFAVGNPRTSAPASVGGANVRLGSMNVLNFFTTFTNGQTADGRTGQGCTLSGATSAANCRGADSLAEFVRQRAKIVNAIAGLNADAVGLMELQNNGNVAAQNLVDALNAQVGAGTYAVVPVPTQGTGSDAIRVGMLYKPAKLTLVGAPVSDPDSVNNRPPLAQTFAALNGERFTLVVNHLKSKSSCPAATDADAAGNTDAGDGQGCWNATRVRQAQRLRTFVAQLQSSGGSPDVLLVGDFNAYAQEDPIFDLTSSGYIDQSGRFETFGYSYVFDGTAGRLDQAIATPTLSTKVTGATHWHIDADESTAQDYNLEFKQPACTTCEPDPFELTTPFRASDHDPVLVGLSLWKTVLGTAGRDVLAGTPGDDILIGGAGADTLTGGGGVNVYVYQSMRDAGDTITDFMPGKDYLDLRTLLASLGYTGSDPVGDGFVKFVSVNGGASLQVLSGGALRPVATLTGVAPGAIVPARDLIVR